MTNALNWFEIPVVDIERAARFYSAIFATEIKLMEFGATVMGFLPASEGGVGGGIVKGDGYVPSQQGTLVYLNGGEDLNVVLNRVEAAGGKVTLAKTDIGENGFMAYFTDTEGNKVGLHSMG